MDLHTVLAQVDSWPVADRLRLMDRIWDGLLEREHEPGLLEQEKAELDRLIAEDDADPDDVVTRDEVKAAALGRVGR